MTDRTVRVRVVADTTAFAVGMRAASGEATAFGAAATRAGRGTRALGAD
ncbi:MAG: hypothetical protein JWO67_1446, partial [Streptosporangiaceae bacterium]|nr:hypothetical protein [Streptosporangiaceae bacterium]